MDAVNRRTPLLVHEEESSFHSKAAAHLPFEYVNDDPVTPSANCTNGSSKNGTNAAPSSSSSRRSMILTLTLALLLLAVASVHSPAALMIAAASASSKLNILCQRRSRPASASELGEDGEGYGHDDGGGGIWNWLFCAGRTDVTRHGHEDGTGDQRQRKALEVQGEDDVRGHVGLKESVPESDYVGDVLSLQPLQDEQQEQQLQRQKLSQQASSASSIKAEEHEERSGVESPFERLAQVKVHLPKAATATAATDKYSAAATVPHVATNYPVKFSGHDDGYDYFFYWYDEDEFDHDHLDGAFLETELGEQLSIERVDEGEVDEQEEYDHDDEDAYDMHGTWYYFDDNGDPVDQDGNYLDDHDADYEDDEENGDEYGDYDYDEDYGDEDGGDEE